MITKRAIFLFLFFFAQNLSAQELSSELAQSLESEDLLCYSVRFEDNWAPRNSKGYIQVFFCLIMPQYKKHLESCIQPELVWSNVDQLLEVSKRTQIDFYFNLKRESEKLLQLWDE